MNVQDYIKVYEDIVDKSLCNDLMNFKHDFKPSTFAGHDKVHEDSKNYVVMDDVWIKKDSIFYNSLKDCFAKAVRQYEYEFPLFMCEHTSDFRINKYGAGGFMSEHVDNIHHSHGQKWGYPHVSALLYLNDDYEGGEFVVAKKEIVDINTRLSSAEATWQMAENLYRTLADQVREHSYDIKDLNR